MKLLCVLLLLGVWQNAIAGEYVVEIEVVNVVVGRGQVNIAMHDSDATYLKHGKQPFRSRSVAAETDRLTVTFDGLASGVYAVTIYQDLNGNGDLDSNFIRLPKEPYGFSNNPLLVFGPPSFKKAAVDVSEDSRIKVKLR